MKEEDLAQIRAVVREEVRDAITDLLKVFKAVAEEHKVQDIAGAKKVTSP